ncbi:GT2 family glycosyltransferase [Enterococcus sp. PF1-24]|nr:GT2 family glycosyltransferase [Enterococcus sp. PFB1-1]MDH6401652.1 GT2 family glycosyltransferase [Enterococcus sp. PF1-24]
MKQEILPNFPAELFIFDNHSSPDFQRQLAEIATEQIHVTYHSENKGFGFGHNYNAQLTKSTYFLICNPDILVEKQAFQQLLTYLESQSDTALVAPKVLYPDGETQYLLRQRLTVFDYALRFVPFGFVKKLFNRRLTRFECRELTDQNTIQEIPFVSGCFMLYRKSDFDAIDGFDENFFMYFEDNDICQKTRQAGKKIVYFPEASIVHFYARDSHKSKTAFTIFMKSMKTYFNKWGWQLF